MTQTLDQLLPGWSATIEAIAGNDGFRRRLLELGLLPGVEVCVLRSAPLGDPLELEVGAFRITVRHREAARIAISAPRRRTPPPGPAPTPAPSRLAAMLAHQGPAERVPADQPPLKPRYRVVLAGNPNSGKTTLFNALTGGRAHVDNYPGSTVDRHVGSFHLGQATTIEVHDLPGMYSINAESQDEQVAVEEIVGQHGARPDAVLVLLNATALARSLYLLFQIREFGLPVVGVVTMVDEAIAAGIDLDLAGLSATLGVPLIPIVARKRQGLRALQAALAQTLGTPPATQDPWRWQPSAPIAAQLDALLPDAHAVLPPDTAPTAARAFALFCLMSLDGEKNLRFPGSLTRTAQNARQTLRAGGCDIALEAAQARHAQIARDIAPHFHPPHVTRHFAFSDRVDAIVTHPIAGLAIFFVLMGLIFTAIFDWAAPLMNGIERAFSYVNGWTKAVLPESAWTNLIADGIIQGVGSVLIFLPQIAILFALLAILQASGYMARAAFVVDRLMKKVGLHGKAFVPLLSGYACAIPAVMATRTLERRRDRLLVMMVIPLISCSARLPVYTLIIGTLFPAETRVLGFLSLGALMMMGLYVASTVLALVAATVIGRTLLRAKYPPLLLELPPYRLPSLRRIILSVWQQIALFLKMAGTVIVVMSVVLWTLLHFPQLPPAQESSAESPAEISASDTSSEDAHTALQLQQSYAGRVGRWLEPALEPLGFDWKIGIGLIGAVAAREVFVATMGLVYGLGDADEDSPRLREIIRTQKRPDGRPVYTPLTGMSLLIFFLIAMQCVSTLAVVRQESHSWKWPALMVSYLTILAYLASLATYQLGLALGLG